MSKCTFSGHAAITTQLLNVLQSKFLLLIFASREAAFLAARMQLSLANDCFQADMQSADSFRMGDCMGCGQNAITSAHLLLTCVLPAVA